MSESITDIVRALRDGSVYNEGGCIYLHEIADRIEAAYKREATCEKSSQVGNNAKMREALKYLRDASREFHHLILNSKHNEICDKYKYAPAAKIRDAIANANAALNDPPRNCDVGTPREQERRMDEWCHNGKGHCRCGDDGCPNYNLDTNCVIDWLQMPYEGGGAK